jgi:hypothetical protein
MTQMTKYRPAGEVQAVQVTENNFEALVEQASGQPFQSPTGERYMLLESSAGTTRAAVGGWIVQHGEGKDAEFQGMESEAFAATYSR